jgi:hypothetical protein
MKAPKDRQITITFSLFRLIERALLIGAFFYLLNLYFEKSSQVNELKYLTEAMNDTIKSYRNKNNEMVSKIKVLETTNTGSFTALKTKDSIINILQYYVKKYKKKLKKQGSVTHIGSSLSMDTTITSTQIMENGYPVYNSKFNLKGWVYGEIKAGKDSTNISLKVKNSYTTIIGRERVGLFKYKPFVEIINHNPYSETKTLRTYQIKLPKQPKIGFGIQTGYGITKSGLSPYLGIGINYKPF